LLTGALISGLGSLNYVFDVLPVGRSVAGLMSAAMRRNISLVTRLAGYHGSRFRALRLVTGDSGNSTSSVARFELNISFVVTLRYVPSLHTAVCIVHIVS